MYLFSCIRFYSDFYLLLHDGMLDTLVTEVTLPVFLYHYDGSIYGITILVQFLKFKYKVCVYES